MKIKCPQCGTVFFIDESEFEEGKKKVKCPGCGKILLVKIKKKENISEHPPNNSTTSSDELFQNDETDFPPPPSDQFSLGESTFHEEDLFGGSEESSIFSEIPEEQDLSSTDEELFGDLPPPEEIGEPDNLPEQDNQDPFGTDLFEDEPLSEFSNVGEGFNEGLDFEKQTEQEEDDFPDFDWDDDEEEVEKKEKIQKDTSNQLIKKEAEEEIASPVSTQTEENEDEEDELKPLINEEEAESFLEEAIVRTSEEKEIKKGSIIGKTILLVIFIIVAGIYVAYRYFPEELPVRNYINSLFQPPPRPDPYHDFDKRTRILAVKIKRIINERGDRLLVFYGRIQNRSKEKISYIKMRIYLLGPDGKPVLTRDFYAGNTFSDEELKLLSPDKIEDRLNNKFGDTFINESVPPGKVIPFMGVIVNPPPFAEFRIVTLSSLPGE